MPAPLGLAEACLGVLEIGQTPPGSQDGPFIGLRRPDLVWRVGSGSPSQMPGKPRSVAMEAREMNTSMDLTNPCCHAGWQAPSAVTGICSGSGRRCLPHTPAKRVGSTRGRQSQCW